MPSLTKLVAIVLILIPGNMHSPPSCPHLVKASQTKYYFFLFVPNSKKALAKILLGQ